jgi:tetratricopeptide (TPR) repeat protein
MSSRGVDMGELLRVLDEVDDEDAFERLAHERPELFGDEMVGHLREISAAEELGAAFEPMLELVEGVRARRAGVLQRYEEAMRERKQEEDELASTAEEAAALLREHPCEETIERGEEVVRAARSRGHVLVAANLHAALAHAYHARVDGDAVENLEWAVRHAGAAAVGSPDAYVRAERESNLGALVAMRKIGDPAENVEQGLDILRGAWRRLDGDAPAGLRATVLTNLVRTLQVRQRGDRLENLREARELSAEAAALRAQGRKDRNWAITTINLAGIVLDLFVQGEAELEEAEATYREVIDAGGDLDSPDLLGVAHAGLGSGRRKAAGKIAREEDREVVGPGDPLPPGERETEHLVVARSNLERACRLLDPAANREELGKAMNELAMVLGALGDKEGELETLRRALELQDPNLTPAQCLFSGFRLGSLLAERGEWELSAKAFSVALRGADLGLHSRLENSDREMEMREAGNLGRWAAFALAKAGELEQAVLALEDGRGREITRRLGAGVDEDQLAAAPEDLRERYLAARQRLAVTGLGSGADPAVASCRRRWPRSGRSRGSRASPSGFAGRTSLPRWSPPGRSCTSIRPPSGRCPSRSRADPTASTSRPGSSRRQPATTW